MQVLEKSKTRPEIKYQRFSQNPALCVCTTIDKYLEPTKEKRSDISQLLISHER